MCKLLCLRGFACNACRLMEARGFRNSNRVPPSPLRFARYVSVSGISGPLALLTVNAARPVRIYALRVPEASRRGAGSLVLQSRGQFCTRSIARLIPSRRHAPPELVEEAQQSRVASAVCFSHPARPHRPDNLVRAEAVPHGAKRGCHRFTGTRRKRSSNQSVITMNIDPEFTELSGGRVTRKRLPSGAASQPRAMPAEPARLNSGCGWPARNGGPV